MNIRNSITSSAVAVVALVLICGTVPPIAAEPWSFSVTPYLWLPNVNADLKYSLSPEEGGGVNVETGPNGYISNLQAVAMISGDARKGKYSLFSDAISPPPLPESPMLEE